MEVLPPDQVKIPLPYDQLDQIYKTWRRKNGYHYQKIL